MFIKYIFAFTNDIKAAAKPEWRLKHLLAENLGNYVSLFDSKTVYSSVALAACSAMSDII